MTDSPEWSETIEADVRFPLVESAVRSAGLSWALWKQKLIGDGFNEVDIRALAQGHAPLAEHAHNYDLRVLVLAGAVTLRFGGSEVSHGHGEHFEIPAHTVHAEAFSLDAYIYLAARRHAVVTTSSGQAPSDPSRKKYS